MIDVKKLDASLIQDIVSAFINIGWNKEGKIFEKYVSEQNLGHRIILCAYVNNEFSGYGTLFYQSKYTYFNQNSIPEISDLNVLPKFRNKGIGSHLMDLLEFEAFKHSKTVGIGVGLYSDYGNAQILYIKRGYIPDGRGVTYNYKTVSYGETPIFDDDLVFWFTKKQ
jgi:GNAT superfamily N-acetyltransferase